jgi:cytochrome c553
MKLPLSCAFAALAAVLAAPANAGNIELGGAKAEQACASCHGKDGNTPIDPSYPKLAGQYRDFLERALLDYRSEARKNAIMVAQVKQLSRADISNLAAYYASLPGSMTVRR